MKTHSSFIIIMTKLSALFKVVAVVAVVSVVAVVAFADVCVFVTVCICPARSCSPALRAVVVARSSSPPFVKCGGRLYAAVVNPEDMRSSLQRQPGEPEARRKAVPARVYYALVERPKYS